MYILDCIHSGMFYLLEQTKDGICSEFDQLRHGASVAWTTACVGSTLSEFLAPKELTETLDALLSLQWENGGWSYNQKVLPDADTTLRVIQFLQKIAFADQIILTRAEQFVVAHQQVDGGIATYLPEIVKDMGYASGGWTVSHPCVSALAHNILRGSDSRKRCEAYLQKLHDAQAYWWKTQWYVLYEIGANITAPVSADPIELGLSLLAASKHKFVDNDRVRMLVSMQKSDGSFVPSHQFRIPRPFQILSDICGNEETVEDKKGIFSTCAAVVALSRQHALLN